MTKFLFITINHGLTRPIKGKQFCNRAEDQEAIPGVFELLDREVADGFTIITLDNQGGVETGKSTIQIETEKVKFATQLFPQISMSMVFPSFERFKGEVLLLSQGQLPSSEKRA